ncbi:OLC1v1031664C1 [Oldenlandia corymbosa var. corymbosa]|uniref:OLC1v1031664C1 n=1 Tax=Oldenlandia corymbosa var. corymbosa TaxID=529605 RepID=A0AAV1CJ18_OLDCO|nr:OLC1v1031664C1 [Oldenlandia corymbosa var. corymbosa]
MYRTSSTTRFSDEFFPAGTNSAAAAAMSSPATTAATSDLDHLPTYNPLSHVAKKEKHRFRSAENAIHLIPLLLVFCAIVLWFFSSPVDMVNESGSLVARVGGSLTNAGGDTNSSWESDSEKEDVDAVNQSTDLDQKSIR